MKRILTGCLLVMVILLGCQNNDPGSNSYDFRLESLDHQRFYLNQYQGKPLVLVFWATHCSICKVELTWLNHSYDTFRNQGVALASVIIDPENKSDLIEIARQLKLTYPILLDRNQRVFSQFGLKAVPTTIIIDEKGKVILNVEGYDPVIQQRILKKVGLK